MADDGIPLAENAGPKQRGRPFKPGQSGNPAGKPRGTRNAALIALDAIGQDGAAAVLRRVVRNAKAGDMRAAEVLLARVWPARKGRPVLLQLQDVRTAAGASQALATVIDGMATGAISPDEASAIAAVIETQRRAIETSDLEARIAALEAAASDGPDGEP